MGEGVFSGFWAWDFGNRISGIWFCGDLGLRFWAKDFGNMISGFFG